MIQSIVAGGGDEQDALLTLVAIASASACENWPPPQELFVATMFTPRASSRLRSPDKRWRRVGPVPSVPMNCTA